MARKIKTNLCKSSSLFYSACISTSARRMVLLSILSPWIPASHYSMSTVLYDVMRWASFSRLTQITFHSYSQIPLSCARFLVCFWKPANKRNREAGSSLVGWICPSSAREILFSFKGWTLWRCRQMRRTFGSWASLWDIMESIVNPGSVSIANVHSNDVQCSVLLLHKISKSVKDKTSPTPENNSQHLTILSIQELLRDSFKSDVLMKIQMLSCGTCLSKFQHPFIPEI